MNDTRPIERVIAHALEITKLTRTELSEIVQEPLGSSAPGRKIMNDRDFPVSDIARLRTALNE